MTIKLFKIGYLILLELILSSCEVNIERVQLVGEWKVAKVTCDPVNAENKLVAEAFIGQEFQLNNDGSLIYSDGVISLIDEQGIGQWAFEDNRLIISYSYHLPRYSFGESDRMTFKNGKDLEVTYVSDDQLIWEEKYDYVIFTYTLEKL